MLRRGFLARRQPNRLRLLLRNEGMHQHAILRADQRPEYRRLSPIGRGERIVGRDVRLRTAALDPQAPIGPGRCHLQRRAVAVGARAQPHQPVAQPGFVIAMGVADERNRTELDQHVNHDFDLQRVTFAVERERMRADRRTVAHQAKCQAVARWHGQCCARVARCRSGGAGNQKVTPGQHPETNRPARLQDYDSASEYETRQVPGTVANSALVSAGSFAACTSFCSCGTPSPRGTTRRCRTAIGR